MRVSNQTRFPVRRALIITVVLAAAAASTAGPAFGDQSSNEQNIAVSGAVPGLEDTDVRTGRIAPTAAQKGLVDGLRANVRWNEYGTPQSLSRQGEFVATGLPGPDAEAAARGWVERHLGLFRLESADGLEPLTSSRLTGSRAHVVHFQQTYDGRPAADGGVLTLGLTGSKGSSWSLAYVSSSVSGDTELAGGWELSASRAWRAAASDIGIDLAAADLGAARADREWTVYDVDGIESPQRAREVAFPTVGKGVRPAWETIVVDHDGGQPIAYSVIVDAIDGEVLLRRNLVHQSHSTVETFTGTMPQPDGACDTEAGTWKVADGEAVGSVVVAVEAAVTANDSTIHLLRDGEIVASQDTLASPEALTYDPKDSGRGSYQVRVCDFEDNAPWTAPNDYVGEIAFSPVDLSVELPYPPSWQVFPANPRFGSNEDTRETWCWEGMEGCDRVVSNLASRAPWDFAPRTGTPTFTTLGNNAISAEAWSTPLTPGATGFRPLSLERVYGSEWQDAWQQSDCFTPFVPGASHDISAAVSNLFVMHNRMHDWSYNLGFTEKNWNAQESNFGTGGTAEHDPVLGDAQAGAVSGGFPSYLGRDNANMVTLPDGVPPITNMYLWQPLAGAFYGTCTDGDFDMSVIGHEYGHLIENRMIGKGDSRGEHHAGAMGESFGDLGAVEYLHENGFVPVGGENPFSVGAYATGNQNRGIRNYGMNNSPLNFSDMGYDITGAQVHADGEIWSAVNHEIRQSFVDRYNTSFPARDNRLQRACADGKRPAAECPGNRRWIQLVYDAMLLMPVAPSMLDARDAYLAADLMRFDGANQRLLWSAFAGRGFGVDARSSNKAIEGPTDPMPDFASPRESNASVRFEAVDGQNGEPVPARIYAGRYEARVSPIAIAGANGAAPNLDGTAKFVPGTYEFVANAPGYGHTRFELALGAGEQRTVKLVLPKNVASADNGAKATGDGANHADLIDDTEATTWDRTGATTGVEGSAVTVDLGGVRSFDRTRVSALLLNQNRFTALRQFELWACDATTAATCGAASTAYEKVYTSPANAFPGARPRPVAPELILRTFHLPSTTATHVRIRVISNQCTGNQAFQGEQDADPLNGTDCRFGSPGSELVELPGDVPQVLAPRDDEVHVAELQLFDGAAVLQ